VLDDAKKMRISAKKMRVEVLDGGCEGDKLLDSPFGPGWFRLRGAYRCSLTIEDADASFAGNVEG